MSRWCSFLLVLCIGIGVQGHEVHDVNLWAGRECLLVKKDHGKIDLADVGALTGMQVELCNDPWTLMQLGKFASSMLCLGMGYKPLSGVTDGNHRVSIPLLNEQFKCSNETVECTGKSLGDIVACYNAVLEVPMCHQVKNTRICAINSKANVGWFHVQVNLCTERGHNIRIYLPEITLHGIDFTSGKNDHVKQVSISDMLRVSDDTILMVPGNVANTLKNLLEWRDARDAPAEKFDLANLRKMWKELCPQDSSLQAAVPCEEMTEDMLQRCKETLDQGSRQNLLKLEACVKQLIPADIVLQKRTIQNYTKNVCQLSPEELTIPHNVLLCSQETVGTNTEQTSSWISSIGSQFSWQPPILRLLFSESVQSCINYALMFILAYIVLGGVFVLWECLKWLIWVLEAAKRAFSWVCSCWSNLSKMYENAPEGQENERDAISTRCKVYRWVCWPLYKLLKFVYGVWNFFSKVVGKSEHKKGPKDGRPKGKRLEKVRFFGIARSPSIDTLDINPHITKERAQEKRQNMLFRQETKKLVNSIKGDFLHIQNMIECQQRVEQQQLEERLGRRLGITSMDEKLAMDPAMLRLYEAQDGGAAGNLARGQMDHFG